MSDYKPQNAPGGEIVSLNGTEFFSTPRMSNTTDYYAYAGTFLSHICQGRLTLTSGKPVTTANVTGATNVYWSPYKGNLIALYDGTRWNLLSFTEQTLALGTLTSGLPYDVFAYINSNAVAVEKLAWSTATARATALTTQDGILVKSGATTRRYLGTFCTTATTTTEDSDSKRYVYNYYNRTLRKMKCFDNTNSWAYTSATYQEIRAGSTFGTSRVGFMVGYAEDVVSARVNHSASSSSGSPVIACGIGLDSSTNVSDSNAGQAVTTVPYNVSAHYNSSVAVGVHYLAMLESGAANVTFYGDNGGTQFQTGMTAEAWM